MKRGRNGRALRVEHRLHRRFRGLARRLQSRDKRLCNGLAVLDVELDHRLTVLDPVLVVVGELLRLRVQRGGLVVGVLLLQPVDRGHGVVFGRVGTKTESREDFLHVRFSFVVLNVVDAGALAVEDARDRKIRAVGERDGLEPHGLAVLVAVEDRRDEAELARVHRLAPFVREFEISVKPVLCNPQVRTPHHRAGRAACGASPSIACFEFSIWVFISLLPFSLKFCYNMRHWLATAPEVTN